MAKNFTFKKEPRTTGLAGVGYPNPGTVIKLDKKEVGTIFGPNWQSTDRLWHIRLMKVDGDSWKWTQLKATFETEPAAREYLKENFDRVCAIGLRQSD